MLGFMTNNDILRRLRYALNLNNQQMIDIFALMEQSVDEAFVKQIIAKEQDDDFVMCRDDVLAAFLDGLIIKHRGLRTPGELPAKMSRIINNEILMKIRIALELKAEDIVDILTLAKFRLSKSELNAFFRKPDHRNYKLCGDQVLRNFLAGLTVKHRG